MAVGANEDLDLGPMAADRPHQATQKRPDLDALRPLGRAQQGGDEAAFAIEDDDRLEAVFVVMSVEQAQLLAAVHRIEGVVDVEGQRFVTWRSSSTRMRDASSAGGSPARRVPTSCSRPSNRRYTSAAPCGKAASSTTPIVSVHRPAVPGRPDPHSDRPFRMAGAARRLGVA